MNIKIRNLCVIVALFVNVDRVAAQGTAFTYQGQLLSNGVPVTGSAFLKFALYEGFSCTNSTGYPLTTTNEPILPPCDTSYEPIPVTNGLFTVELDFGPAPYNGQSLWLAIYESSNGAAGTYTLMTNVAMTPTPYAIYAENAANISGNQTGFVSFNNESDSFVGTFNGSYIGNGSGLTGVNAASLTSGAALGAGAGNNIGSGSTDSFIGGGWANFILASSPDSFIGSGSNNIIQMNAGYSAIGGGQANQTSSGWSFIGGGNSNYVGTGTLGSTIGGGYGNTNSGNYSTIGGGWENTVSAGYSTVPGGFSNLVSGSYSFAAGAGAQALNNLTFVWSDGAGTPFASTGPQQFLVRATGGVGINKNNPGSALDVNGGITSTGLTVNGNVGIGTSSPQESLSVAQGMNIDQANADTSGPGFQNSGIFVSQGSISTGPTLTFGSGSGEGIRSNRGSDYDDLELFTAFTLRLAIDNGGLVDILGNAEVGGGFSAGGVLTVANGNVGVGTASPSYLFQVGSYSQPAYCDGMTWHSASDRNAKRDLTAIDPMDVLKKVAEMPITEWEYKQAPAGVKHIGPMAQDFHAAFGLDGDDDTHVSSVDEDGVALAAIQGLNQKLQETEQAEEAKNGEIKDLKEQNEMLAHRLSALEQMVQNLAQKK